MNDITMKHENISAGSTSPSSEYLKGLAERPAPSMRDVLRAATSAATESDLGRWRASGARLLEIAQARLSAAQHAYTVDRAKLDAEQSRRLTELSVALREERRAFERSSHKQLGALSEQVQCLLEMREAGDGWDHDA